MRELNLQAIQWVCYKYVGVQQYGTKFVVAHASAH